MIRPVKPEDYEQIAPLWNSIYTNDNYTPKEFAYIDSVFEPPRKFQRFVLEEAGEIVGATNYAQFAGQYHPQKFMCNVFMREDKRRQGLGSELYDFLLKQLEPFDPIALSAMLREDDEAAKRFARSRSFKETKRDWESVLDISSFEADAFETSIPESVELTSYADWGVTPERDELFYQFFSHVRMDIPSAEPRTEYAFEHFRKQFLDAPDYFAEGVFFALTADKPVGMAMFWRSESTKDLFTGLTAVAREHRGKGLATALKLKALRFAKQYGAQKVFTDNDSRNVEMIAINEKLGFEQLPAWVSLRKTL